MTAIFLTQIWIALIIFFLLAFLLRKGIFSHPWLLAVFFIVYFADNLIIVLTNRFSSLQLVPNHIWEGFLVCSWSGKLYSILFTLSLLYLGRSLFTPGELGVTLRQRPGSLLPSGLVVLALAAWAVWVGVSSPDGEWDLQTLLYLVIMPGLNEELVYRGALLGILDKIMPGRLRIFQAPIGWGVLVTSLLFGLLHGFWLDNHLAVHIELIALRNSMLSGFIFAWLRERTGSLVVPVIAHGLEDFLFFLPRMV